MYSRSSGSNRRAHHHSNGIGIPMAYSDRRRTMNMNTPRHHHNRSPSPPMAFRRSSHPSSYSRPPSFRSRPIFRGGRPAPRFMNRGGRPHIPYHSRPDISPPRSSRPSRSQSRDRISRAERSPRSPQARNRRSRSRTPRVRDKNRRPSPVYSSFRGSSSRKPRTSAIIGNFGQPIFHKPDYEVSPDRTAAATNESALDAATLEVPEDRGELFARMMRAKRDENLDDYYRLRDMLNEFDRRRSTGQLANNGKKRHSSPGRGGEGSGSDRKKRRTNGDESFEEERKEEELEEVDCSERDEVEVDADEALGDWEEGNEEPLERGGAKHGSNRKERKSKSKVEDRNGTSSAATQQHMESAFNDNHLEELDYDEKSIDDGHPSRNADDGKAGEELDEYEEEVEGEINFDLVDNEHEKEEEAGNKVLQQKRRLVIVQESEDGQESDGSAGTHPLPFRHDFLPLLQKALHNGLAAAMETKKRRSAHRRKVKRHANAMQGEGGGVPSLLELALAKVVAGTALEFLR